MSKLNREELVAHFSREFVGLFDAIMKGLFGREVPLTELGIPEGAIESIVEDVYLEIFTEKELNEMVAHNERFSKRTALASQLVEARLTQLKGGK